MLLQEGITREELTAAIPKAIKLYPDWPPKLGRFVEICRPNSPAYHQRFPEDRQLPEPPEERARRREVAERHILQAMQSLGMNTDPAHRERRRAAVAARLGRRTVGR